MKPTSYAILSLVVVLWHDVASANGGQVAWRWRNDDGDVYSATWKDSANTPVVLTQYENIRLRIEYLVGEVNVWSVSLRYTEYPDIDSSWIPITSVDTGRFFISPSPYLNDAMSYFDNQLLPPYNPDNVYRRTLAFDSSCAYRMVDEESSVYELEYSLKPTMNIQPGSAYFFSCFLDDSPMNSGADWERAVLLTPPVSWKSQSIGRRYTLNDIFFVDGSTATAVGSGGSGGRMFKTVDAGKTWIDLPLPACKGLSAVQFVNAEVGVAVGSDGTILRTTDGGQNWLFVASTDGFRYLSGVAFSDEQNGTIVGGYSGGGGGIMLRTTDGGESWFQQQCPTSNSLLSVCFSGADQGIAVGAAGTIVRTTNGGEHWFVQSSGTTRRLRDICFSDANHGTIVGEDSGRGVALRTSDGGITWTSVHIEGPVLNAVCFADNSTGWTVGVGGWMCKTTDGGLSWKRLTSGTCRSLCSVHFVNSEIGWVVGEGGTILRTTNGGTTSVDNDKLLTVPTETVLLQNYPNPFNPSTTITYHLPKSSHVRLSVYDMLGREVSVLVNERRDAGAHQTRFQASELSSGVYLYRLMAGECIRTKKMMVLR